MELTHLSRPPAGRRQFCGMLAALGAALPLRAALREVSGAELPRSPAGSAQEIARDQQFWREVAALYDVDRSITNLENGYWGVMPVEVQNAYVEKIKFVNRFNSVYARSASLTKELEAARVAVANIVGCAAHELALTRSGSEALQSLVVNYNQLRPGDSVIYADLDYDSVQDAMDYLAQRRSVNVVKFEIPEPATRANILEAYERVLRTAVRPKLLLVTHLSHRTGLVLPVAQIVQLARARGVDVIVDAAQSIGQVDFKLADLGADFVGFCLHKWMGAPLGNGCLYIRESRLKDIDAQLKTHNISEQDTNERVHTGTTNYAAQLTIPAALAFQTRLGIARKAARLRYLRDYWVERVRHLDQLEILTPPDPTLYAGMTSFRFRGEGTSDNVQALQQTLLLKHKILTVARKGIAKGDAIRITPGLYTDEADLDQLVTALKVIAADRGRSGTAS